MIPRLKPRLGLPELCGGFRPPHDGDIECFEQSFAKLMGQNHALAFPYGRTGLILLLEALGLKNKEIICPAYTCVVVPHAITYSGNVPIFVDCELGSFNMDIAMVEKAITEETGAIIATSLFGYPIDLERLCEIRKRYPHIHVVQDCAHSFAAEWKEKPVQGVGTAALFGLNISKTLTSIFGGMVTTDNRGVYEKLKAIRDQKQGKATWGKGLRRLLYLLAAYPTFWEPFYGVINRLERIQVLNYFARYYDDSKIDMPADYLQGICGIEARVGMANLKRYDRIISDRRDAAMHYFESLGSVEGDTQRPNRASSSFVLPPDVKGATYSHFVVQVTNRKEWLEWGISQGVQLGWVVEYSIPEMRAYGSRPSSDFPVAAKYAKNSINLPVWGGKETAEKVVRKLFKAKRMNCS